MYLKQTIFIFDFPIEKSNNTSFLFIYIYNFVKSNK